jgi:hypothetical protein
LRLTRPRGHPSRLSSERSFAPRLGAHFSVGGDPRGYYIDFRDKAPNPAWPPAWLPDRAEQLHVTTAQWGLGAFERYLSGEGEEWLAAATAAGRHLVAIQEREGSSAGGWSHLHALPHTYRLDPPWLSAMAQGEGASLLARVHRETGDERFAEAARLALRPMSIHVAEGGVRRALEGGPFLEEYPTEPASHVLNGAIFAIWGYRDVAAGLDDRAAAAEFESLAEALAGVLGRFDLSYWSRYDLFPHPVPNVASPAYHLLHIRQLEAMERLRPDERVREALGRFRAYRASARCRRRALAGAVAFRLLVPRNRLLARRLPRLSTRRAAARRSP